MDVGEACLWLTRRYLNFDLVGFTLDAVFLKNTTREHCPQKKLSQFYIRLNISGVFQFLIQTFDLAGYISKRLK